MATQQSTVRFSDATREKLEFLATRYNSQTEALAVAIDRLYQMEQGQQQWTISRIRQVDKPTIVSVIDELAYQAAIRNKPKHEYDGKPHRVDFVVWQGQEQDIPEIYR